jgi:hypothetical protein
VSLVKAATRPERRSERATGALGGLGWDRRVGFPRHRESSAPRGRTAGPKAGGEGGRASAQPAPLEDVKKVSTR